MRYCGILVLPCAVLRYSYPPYAPLRAVERGRGHVNKTVLIYGENRETAQ